MIDWNTETASDILMDGIFEDLYHIAYGEPYRESTDCIPGDLFERIMTTYLPVTIEQLRNAYTYDAEKMCIIRILCTIIHIHLWRSG